MWNLAIKVTFYTVAGFGLILAVCWYLRSLKEAVFGGGDIVIADFTVVGKDDTDNKVAKALAQMLQARLREVCLEISAAQLELSQQEPKPAPTIGSGEAAPRNGGSSAITSGAQADATAEENDMDAIAAKKVVGIRGPVEVTQLPPLWNAGPALLGTRLLDSPTFNVTVSGVDVGGAIQWIERQLASSRTLHFTYYQDKKKAQVSGDLNAAGIDGALRVKLDIAAGDDGVPLDVVVERTAYEILRQRLALDAANRVEVLEPEEFPVLVQVLRDAAKRRRTALLGRDSSAEFANLFKQLDPLARKVEGWYQLQLFAATIAENAGKFDECVEYCATALKVLEKDKEVNAQLIQVVMNLQARANRLAQAGGDSGFQQLGPEDPAARKKIEADMRYAVEQLNGLFSQQLKPPPLVFLKPDERNAYTDMKSYFAPPAVQYLPDVTYHNMSMFYLRGLIDATTESPLFAIGYSYSDVLPMVIQQRKLGKNAKTASWVLGEGSVAWIKGDDVASMKDRRGIRSIKEPGSAYDDPVVGKDEQVSSMSHYLPDDGFNSFRLNSGILNRAFYLAADKLEGKHANRGTERAAEIWIGAIPLILKSEKRDFWAFAKALQDSAGDDKAEIHEALVGVELDPAKTPP